ncbi:MAG: hypothetical protein HYU03_00230 [Thaumarchaeota archaeon]|nr:hypothetical protein [Nitrososphaerota archaeon]
MSSQKALLGLAAISIIAILLSGTVLALSFSTTRTAVQPSDRVFYLAAVEPKGTTNVSKEPFPTQALPSGGGYALKEPDKDGNWVVETYIWEPSVLVAYQGDRITLHMLGVNGVSHPAQIEGYGVQFEVKRGQLTTVEFVAEKVGSFQITCSVHQPSMTATLLVLPRA